MGPSNCLKIHTIAFFFFFNFWQWSLLTHLWDFRSRKVARKSYWWPISHEMSGNNIWHPAGSAHSCSLSPHGQFWDDVGMWSKAWASEGKHTALTLQISSSGQDWRSHLLESRQFLIDKGLKIHSLLMPFFPWSNIVFPAFYFLSVIHCL